MKLQLERDEVRKILTSYATHQLGIPANEMFIDGADSVHLSYDPALNGNVKQSLWKRLMRWSRS